MEKELILPHAKAVTFGSFKKQIIKIYPIRRFQKKRDSYLQLILFLLYF